MKIQTLPSIILPTTPSTASSSSSTSSSLSLYENNYYQNFNTNNKNQLKYLLKDYQFTPFIVKPTYEEIYDCIVNENLKQLKKYVLDSFGDQIYSWRNANIVTSIHTLNFIDSIPLMQKNITLLNNLIEKAAAATATTTINTTTTTTTTKTAKKITKSIKKIEWFLSNEPELFLSRNGLGITPLHQSILFRQYEIVTLIVKRLPITLDACDYQGRTPLHYAALLSDDHGQMYCRLVELGARTTVTDMYLRRPEDYLQIDSIDNINDQNNNNNNNSIIASTVKNFDEKIDKKLKNSIKTRRPSKLIIDTYNGNSSYNHDNVIKTSSNNELKLNHSKSSSPLRSSSSSSTSFLQPINDNQQNISLKTSTNLPIVSNGTQLSPTYDYYSKQDFDNSNNNRFQNKSANSIFRSRSPSPSQSPTTAKIIKTNNYYNSSMSNRLINVKEIIRQGNLSELEELVLNGYGDKLLGEIAYSSPLVQEFIDNLPNYLEQIDELHKSATRGNVKEFQSLLDRYSLICSRDPLGATPLHKAVLYNHYNLVKFIIINFGPNILYLGDNDKRTPLHYAAGLNDRSIYNLLLKYGPKAAVITDQYNHTADFYLRSPEELNIELIKKRSIRSNTNYSINLANKIKLLKSSSSPSPTVATTTFDFFQKQQHTSPFKRKQRSLSPNWNHYQSINTINNPNNNYNNNNEEYLNIEDYNSTIIINENMDTTTAPTTATIAGETADDESEYVIDNEIIDNNNNNNDDNNTNNKQKQNSNNENNSNISNGNNSNTKQKMEVNSANLKKWIEENNIPMLEDIVLEGHGERLQQKASKLLLHKQKSNDHLFMTKDYIEKTVPIIMNKIKNIHHAVSMGDLTVLKKENLEKKRDYILSKDHLGMTPLHKATIMGHVNVVQYILDKFPETVNAKDHEGRTALHYSTATTNRNGIKIYKMLIKAGADSRVRDSQGKTPDYYRVHYLPIPNETLRPSGQTQSMNALNHIHSKIENSNQKHQRQQQKRHIIHPAIREKINNALHTGNVMHLEELLLDGYGQELIGRTSFDEDARKYLKSIPNQIERINELHQSIINGDDEQCKEILQKNPQFIRTKDQNSFTPFHLAVINGHTKLINFMCETFPNIVHVKDNMNRNALHLSALSGNGDIYRRLIEIGFDPKSIDQKGKTAEYYLRNNAAITPTELSELLALSSTATTPIPSLSTHNPRTLTKLSKAPALTTTTTTSNSSSSTTPTTNADNSNIINTGNNIMTSSAKKLGAKPSRLPALHNNKLEKQSTKSIDDESSIEAKDKEPAETEPSAPAAEQAKEEKNVIQEARKSSSTSVKSINNNDDINANNVDNINDNANNNNDTLNVTSNDDGKDSNVDNKNGDGVDDDKIKENVDDDNSPKTNETLIDVESKNNNNNNETNDNVVAADDNDDKQQQQQQQKDDTNVNKNEEFINVASGEENLLQNNNNNDNNDDNVNVDDDKINTLTVEQLDVNNDNNNSNNDNENIGNNNNDEGNNLSPKTNEDKVVANDNKMVNESNINDNNKSENDGVINQTEDSNDYKNDDNEIEQQSEKEPVIIYSRIDQEKIIENYESLWTNIENGDGLDDENNNNNNNDNLNENSEKIENNTDNNGKDEEKPIDDKRSDIVDDGDANANNNNNTNNDTDKDDKNGDNNNNKIKDKSISVIKEEDEEDQDEDDRENVENKNENNGDNNEIESSSSNKQENIDEKNEPDAKIEAKDEQSSDNDNQQQDPKTDSDIIGTDSNKNQLDTNQADDDDDDDDAKRQKQQSMMTIDTNLIDENVDDPKGKNENDDENESKNNNNSNVMNDDERQQQQQQQQKMEPILNQIDTTNENQNKAETLEIKNDDDDDDNNANTNTNANNNNDNSVLNEKNEEKISDTVNNDDNNNNNNNNGNNEINSNNRDEKNMDDKNIKPSSSNVDDDDDDDGSKSQSKNQDIMAEAAENVDEQKSKSELQNDSSIDDDVNTTAAAAAAKEPNEKKNDDLNEFNQEKLQKMIDGSTTKRTISARTNVPDMNHDRLNELIKGWLEDGDLIRLEHVVIAGQGHRLLNIQSENKQVQDFLNLVPHYMDKIRKIHDLVIKGNFDEIEKTLTRKRFALCRDKYGNSPLHLSVLHGHIDILLYIITQFPETIDGPDNDGRTPLHYAAVLPDKQIYQILETAGANKKQTDRHGYTPVNYLTNGKLTIRDLLIKYKNDKNNISSLNNNNDSNDNSTKADLWERPPTSEIVSQLTPESGSVPSSANGDNSQQQRRPSTIDLMNEAGKNSLMPKANNDDDESTINDDNNNKKDVQILQIEPRELKDEPSMNDNEFMSTESNEVDNNSDNDNDSTRTVIIESSTKSPIKNQSPIDDKVFENLSNEFNQTLRNEKLRLRESIDQQIENSDVIKNGQSGSIIDSIQSAAEAKSLKISNGLSAAGYDLTQIKDEHGRTVLHLAAAKDQKRNTFYKMLQQARYLVPELDSKYRTIRDIAVQNGIKNNLQVIDQFIIDSFLNEDEDYLRLLLLEGYSTLLTVVDSEGNDIISLLKRNNKNKIQTFIHEAAELQKMRDELHTFIRNGYMEGVVDLIENNSQLVLAKSNRGRTSLHLAVLFGNLNIIEKIIKTNPKVINVPDNLGRTPLHYAMAMSKMEEMGTILINSGADKAIRDVRMRMPSYYFVYKQDIRDIKREEQNLTI